MFLLVFLIILFSNYIIVADMDEKYKISYAVVIIAIVALIALMKLTSI